MQKAIVIHSDILGFKEIIEKAETDKNDETLNRLKEILDQSFGTLTMYGTLEDHTKTKLNYKLFSDNLYASFSYEEGNLTSFSDAFITAITFARTYFENMLNNRIAVRGGISFGNDYSDEKLIFSMALVKAYTLESKKAIYPRIVIDNDLIDTVKKQLEVPSQLILDILSNSILYDQENIHFINPSGMALDFNSELNGHKGIELDKIYIKQNIHFATQELQKINTETDEGKKVAKKYEWLIDILLWNYTDRQKEAKLNSFKILKFGKT